ncbi:MarR family transcriptional regulator [Enterococcus durans]|uniref:MarR family winged helix-turn-helix transcriptional regulator n=1 Tax=Enterococcus durans TaxID=53345 RepID=UPI000F4E8949|nr:MarR family transcriptional regulator [Enterococcus durans]ROX82835.1 MarR family transcriptional regulator [Enterococcus durans]HJG22272.1 MarR family transcriptional regulator [Enterococcus durans]
MEDLYLENQLCFPLYAASKEITKYYTPLLKPLGLTYTQYLVMLILWEKHQVTMKDLGKMLCLDSGTLTPVIKKLAEKEYLTRARDTLDERIVRISLTDNGRILAKKAETIPSEIFTHLPLEPDELVLLQKLTTKMVNNFRHTT